jgi:phage tail sheath protein FI
MPSYLSPGVYVEEVDSGSRPIEGVGTAVAAFVGFAEKGPLNEPTLITNWSQFVSVYGDFVDGTYLASAVYGFFANGGGICYVVRIGMAEAAEAAPVELGPYLVRPLPGATRETSVEVRPVEAAEGEEPPQGAFTLVVRREGEPEETYPSVTTRRGRNNVVTQVNARSRLIVIEEPRRSPQLATPEPQTLTLASSSSATPARLSADEYVGDADQRTGFGGLEAVDEITMISVPDLMSAYEQQVLDLEAVVAVQQGLISHCEAMGDRMAILDPPPGMTPQQVKEWRSRTAGFDSRYAALYYPWIKVFDPGAGRHAFVPPSGHVAGLWARTDDLRGVHKAPANEVVRGAVGLQTQLTKGENDLLNPIGVNCIRAFPARGIRVWGARTLASDPAWRYLNVRRLFNYLEESILAGTQWVVFEPNDDALWARVRRTISAFLVNEWRKGALFGLTPDEAFYVKCDRETNPPEIIDAGQVVCEIGIAPVKPAEFVVFRLAQMSSGAGAVDE